MKCGVRGPGSAGPELRVEVAASLGDDSRKIAWPLAVAIAAGGCVLGLPAIFLSEAPGGLLGPWVWAPVIEEAFKPFGVYLLLARWPAQLSAQSRIAALSAIAGLSFGLIESVLYVFVYVGDDAPENYALIRFTVPVAMHTVASGLFGFGFNREVFQSIGAGRGIAQKRWPFLVGAIVLHAAYNVTVTVWELLPRYS
jgi:RsiW-degrading membrane proteinase PrsW (M82 family)